MLTNPPVPFDFCVTMEHCTALIWDLSQVREAVAAALDCEELSIVNIMIHPMAGRRAQQHEWLTRAKL